MGWGLYFSFLFCLGGIADQSCERASFWSPNSARARYHKPEPFPSPRFIFEARFRPEGQICRVSQDKRNCGASWNVVYWYSCKSTALSHLDQNIGLTQGFPTFFAARTPLSGQSILSTPQKILRYILLYKRYISCSVAQGSSYPLMFNLVPLGGTSTPGWESLVYVQWALQNFWERTT